MRLCEKCQKEPMAKGIKIIKCLKCSQKVLTNVEYSMICEDCCKESNTCIKCGKNL